MANDNQIYVGRSLDWMEDPQAALWALPAGIIKNGMAESGSISWTSKYGSVVTTLYGIGAVDGINTQGLHASLLYLSEADYGKAVLGKSNLNVLSWAQYVLDNFATVDDAVKMLALDKINIIPYLLANGFPVSVRLILTDISGMNAIIEYDAGGKLVIIKGVQYKSVANSPTYALQETKYDDWKALNATSWDANLPGSGQSLDRFIRASYYLDLAEKNQATQVSNALSIATVFSIIRNASVPNNFFNNVPSDPYGKIRTFTRWRTVTNLNKKIYYFEETNKPNIFWVELNKLDLKQGGEVKQITLLAKGTYDGDATKMFKATKMFVTPIAIPKY